MGQTDSVFASLVLGREVDYREIENDDERARREWRALIRGLEADERNFDDFGNALLSIFVVLVNRVLANFTRCVRVLAQVDSSVDVCEAPWLAPVAAKLAKQEAKHPKAMLQRAVDVLTPGKGLEGFVARLPAMNAFIARVVLRAVQGDLTLLATMSKEAVVK